MSRQILWCSEVQQGKNRMAQIWCAVWASNVDAGQKNTKFACECSTQSLVEVEHGLLILEHLIETIR